MLPVTGWFDPSPKGGALRLAANSYLPAKGDPAVRLPGLRRGDLIELINHTSMQQQFPSSQRIMICAVAMRVRRNVHVEEPCLAVTNRHVRVFQLNATIKHALHFRSGQSGAGFILR